MDILRTENLECSQKTENGEKKVFRNVNISLRAGEIVSLKGPSGSGKTTFLNALSMMIPVDSGRMFLKGAEATSISPMEWRSMVALVNQKHTMLAGTIRDNLLAPFTLKVNRGKETPTDDVLREELNILALSDVSLDDDSSKISIGQAARVAFLRSLLMKPAVLLLDETTAPLDRDSAAALEKRVGAFSDAGGCAIVVAHSDDVFRDAGKYFVRNGTIEK